MPDARPSRPTHASDRPWAVQWLLLAALLALIGGLMLAAQWRERQAITQAEFALLRTQARMADELLHTQIQSADAALRTMLQSMDRWRGPQGYLPFAHEHLQRVANMMPGTRTFAVLDAGGVCRLSNRTELLGQNLSHRTYFSLARDGRNDQALYIAPPYSTLLKVWTVTLSRSIRLPDGSFGGVVVASLSPEFFENLMQELRYAPDMRVALLHDGGQMYVVSPPRPAFVAQDLLQGSTFFKAHLRSGQPESEHTGQGLDQSRRMAVVRDIRLAGLQASNHFVTVASRDHDAVYATWRANSLTLLGIWLGLLALFAVLLTRYQHQAQRLQQKVRLAVAAREQSQARFEQLADNLPSMLYDFETSDGGQPRMLYVSPYSQTLLGVPPHELLNDPDRVLASMVPQDQAHFKAVMRSAIAARSSFECEFRVLAADGQTRWIKTAAVPNRSAPAPAPGRVRYSGFAFDITETKSQQVALHELAYKDALTGADNRRSFMDKLAAELARVRRYHNPASLLMLDIDFFKKVNDNYGHPVGDEVLKHLVQVLRADLREMDTLGRLGGEEFAVLLPDTGLEAALALAERLRLSVQNQPAVIQADHAPDSDSPGGGMLRIGFTVSIGVACMPDTLRGADHCLKAADDALYQAKQTGRNRVCEAAAPEGPAPAPLPPDEPARASAPLRPASASCTSVVRLCAEPAAARCGSGAGSEAWLLHNVGMDPPAASGQRERPHELAHKSIE